MWSDNETDKDFLNFRYVADIAAEMIAQANGRPLSMGISGSWGVGKSSLMKLLGNSLKDRTDHQFLFVEFNAWLYQGYDDTRAALMEIIAQAILDYAQTEKGAVSGAIEKALGLLARVNWFRLASLSATTAAALAVGLPPMGLIGEGFNVVKGLMDGNITKNDINSASEFGTKAVPQVQSLIKDKKPEPPASPPRAIHDFRADLTETLEKLGVTLVVLIDDLDRCLPTTAISTLEAMRLFLFLKHTAFIIAADDKMIRESVRAHFKDVQLDDDLITNYFDKLIQVPIRVPPLGTQEVRAYLMMLFIENSNLETGKKEEVRAEICNRLGETWAGKRVDKAFVVQQIGQCSPELASQLDLADRIAPILTTAKKIAGNPRLIKRFLNTLSIRLSIAKMQHVSIDEPALAKMLLFERCGPEKAYASILSDINESDDGKSRLIQKLEKAVGKDSKDKLDADWDTEFAREWLTLQPSLADLDLRGVVYVSREHLPIISATDRMSPEAVETLAALIELKTETKVLQSTLAILPKAELVLITDKLLSRARGISDWGTPTILYGLLTIAQIDGEHVQTIAGFFKTIPPSQLTPSLVPLLASRTWATSILEYWHSQSAVTGPLKKALTNALGKDKK